MCGTGAGQDRRQDEQVQNETAVVPVRTSSLLTKLLSRHVGQSGSRWSGTGSDNLRGAVISVFSGDWEGAQHTTTTIYVSAHPFSATLP